MRKLCLALVLVIACIVVGACSVEPGTASGPVGSTGSTHGETTAAGHSILLEMTGNGAAKATSIRYGAGGENLELAG
jgi:hypothetical protein